MEERELQPVGQYEKMDLLRTAINKKDADKIKEILLDALKKAKPEPRGFPISSEVLQEVLPLLEKHFWLEDSLEGFLMNNSQSGFSLIYYFHNAQLDYSQYRKFRNLSEKFPNVAKSDAKDAKWWKDNQNREQFKLFFAPAPSPAYNGDHPKLTFETFLVEHCRNDFDRALRAAIRQKRYVFADEAVKRGAKLSALTTEELKAACTLGIFAAVKLYTDAQSKQEITNNNNEHRLELG